jgi:hypothetical protein
MALGCCSNISRQGLSNQTGQQNPAETLSKAASSGARFAGDFHRLLDTSGFCSEWSIEPNLPRIKVPRIRKLICIKQWRGEKLY